MQLLTLQYEATLAAHAAAQERQHDPLADTSRHEAVVALYVAALLASYGGPATRAMEIA